MQDVRDAERRRGPVPPSQRPCRRAGSAREPDRRRLRLGPHYPDWSGHEEVMMHSPFPGMDPYLEAPSIWPDVHTSLMSIFREQLTPLLAPKYLAELETQVVIDRLDDDPIEIDLLHRYPRMPFDDPLPPAHYLVMVCKAGERPRSSVWPISVRQPLPTIPIPLLSPDPAATLGP